MVDSEDEQDEGRCEAFGVLRLPLKPGTASGYVGVQRSASKRRPWQATLKPRGRKRLNVGSFKTAQEAAVGRARAKADGAHLLASPRKQAARNSGARPCQTRLLFQCPTLSEVYSHRSARLAHVV